MFESKCNFRASSMLGPNSWLQMFSGVEAYSGANVWLIGYIWYKYIHEKYLLLKQEH